jgi:hypothetical protein
MSAQQNTANTAVRRVRWIALGAAELMSAVGEFHLAQEIGIHPYLAWLLPVALGVYGFCAFATGHRADVFAALGLMIVCQGMAHLLAIGLIPRHWSLVLITSAVAPIVCWRVHHLGQTPPASEPIPTPADAAPVTVAPAVAPASVAPVCEIPEPVDTPADDEQVCADPAPVAEVAPLPSRPRRSRAEWRTLIETAQQDHPDFSRAQLANHVGCTPRWLRTCLAA